MRQAFDDAATLNVVVKSDAISFPSNVSGRQAITEVLVSEFGRTYENVRTFCFSSPPLGDRPTFSCDWLVGLSAKESHLVRVGCGRYDWIFRSRHPHLATKLTITIEVMELLPSDALLPVMSWFDQLPYPWCWKQTACEYAPALAGLDPVRQWLRIENCTPD